MAGDLASKLERHGIRMTESAFLRLLARALGNQRELLAGPSINELSVAERTELEEAGFDLKRREWKDGGPLARSLADYMALLETGLSVQKAARRLGVRPGRIRQRLRQKSLYGFKVENAWVVPAFQFSGKRVLPGLEEVLPHVSADMHPLSIFYLFTTPQNDLRHPISNGELSPRDWLIMGLSPAPVAELAGTLGVS